MSKILSVIVTEEDGGFVALNPDTYVASQGGTLDEALANLKEAVELYLEETAADIPDTSGNTLLTTVTIWIMPISGKQAIKILEKNGFTVVRQKGSHVVLSKQTDNGKNTTVVPAHKELKKGTIRSIAKLSGMHARDFGL